MSRAPPGRRRTRPDRPAPDGVTRSPFGARHRESRPETRSSQIRQCHTWHVEPLKVATRILGKRPGVVDGTQFRRLLRAGRPAVTRESAVGREACGRSARASEREWRPRPGARVSRSEPDSRNQQESSLDDRRRGDRGYAGDEVDDGVEIVVVPVAANPRRIGRIRVRDRRQPGEEDRENYRENAARLDHTAMIASALGQVKDPPEGEVRKGLEVRDLAGLLPRGLTGLQITSGVPIFQKHLAYFAAALQRAFSPLSLRQPPAH